MKIFALVIVTQMWLVEMRPKSWREGPIVDPGVFVITQIKECRNRMGYCILGNSCDVDSDFVKDDLGGHCDSLSKAFSPKASFVCCRQNPANFEVDDLEAVILEHNIGHKTATQESPKISEPTPVPAKKEKSTTLTPRMSTSIVTEMVTKLQTQTESVTKIEDITKVVTQIMKELVDSTGVGYQDQTDIPEDWMLSTESQDNTNKADQTIVNFQDEQLSQNIESKTEVNNESQKNKIDNPVVMGSINRMDEAVMSTKEEIFELDNDDTTNFLPSLGAPSYFSSVLNTVPEILSGPWLEIKDTEKETNEPESPSTWGELQSFGSNQLYDNWEDEVEENIPNWDSPPTEDEFSNSGSFLSPIASSVDGAGQGLVYEFEIGQTIAGAQGGQSSVLRPGLVIDDPSLLDSIVSTSFVNVNEKKDDIPPVGIHC